VEINRLKLMVAGIGSIGKRHVEVLYSSLGCKDIIVYDKVRENASSFADKYPGVVCVETLEEGLEKKPDAVFITSPAAYHMDQALQALKAGAHVMVEKPLDISFKNTNKVKELAAKKSRIVSVAFCMRYHTGVMRCKEIVDSGVIGKVNNIRVNFSDYLPDARPDYKNTQYIVNTGAFEYVHGVDLAFWLGGGEPEQICGITSNNQDTGFVAPDSAEVLFRTSTGVVANVTMSAVRITGKKLEMNIYGTEGCIEFEFSHTDYNLAVYKKTNRQAITEQRNDLYRNQEFEREDREFVEDVLSGVQRGCSVADAERSLKVYWEVYGNEIRNGERD